MVAGELPAEDESRLAGVGELDLLLVVLTYQHAATAGGVVRILAKAVHTHLPDARVLILHWDAGSTHGTLEAVAEAPTAASEASAANGAGSGASATNGAGSGSGSGSAASR